MQNKSRANFIKSDLTSTQSAELTRHKKTFSLRGLITIFCLLGLGMIFVFFEKTYSFEVDPALFEVKIPLIKKYRIGFMTDAHAKVKKNGLVYPDSEIPMQSFISEMNNNFHPDFVIDGGDFIDGSKRFGEKSMKDYLGFSKIFETIQAPKYKVLGNHDLRGMTRKTWTQLNGYEKSYYYFDYDKLRVIVFDSTLMPDPDDLSKEKAYREEVVWLENLLKNSQGYKKVVFTHYPLIPAFERVSSKELISEFNRITSQYGVRAVFSGHVEVVYYEKINGVDYFIVPGFFRSENKKILWRGSFAEITIGFKNHLKLFYKKDGDDDYRNLIIPSAEYENIKKEIDEKTNFLDQTE